MALLIVGLGNYLGTFPYQPRDMSQQNLNKENMIR